MPLAAAPGIIPRYPERFVPVSELPKTGRERNRRANVSQSGQACQHRKVKCDLDTGKEQCARCTRLGLKCVVNKSLQTLLDGENEWKSEMEAKVEALEAALAHVQSMLNLPGTGATPTSSMRSASYQHSHHHATKAEPGHAAPAPVSPTQPRTITAMTRENSVEPETQETDEQAIVSAPMASLYEVTKLRNIRSDPWAHAHSASRSAEPDFIAQGRVSLEEAEHLFTTFQGSLNAYLWGGIALMHDSLDSARSSSALLTASILAVTALHTQDDGRAFDLCYPIFLELVSQAMFDRYHTLDDVRGLCIGAFYLSDLSWKLSGLAVRIATELNLHQFCAKALRDGTSYGEEARLWYFLYVCDHHFSIAYGRPPVINENPTITCHEQFLQRADATQSDFRLHSQVGIFIILSRVFHTFGPDRSRMIGSDEFETLRRFDADMGYWRDRWKDRLSMCCPWLDLTVSPANNLRRAQPIYFRVSGKRCDTALPFCKIAAILHMPPWSPTFGSIYNVSRETAIRKSRDYQRGVCPGSHPE